MGSGLVVGLGSMYRIIQIYVPDLPGVEGRVTIGVGRDVVCVFNSSDVCEDRTYLSIQVVSELLVA